MTINANEIKKMQDAHISRKLHGKFKISQEWKEKQKSRYWERSWTLLRCHRWGRNADDEICLSPPTFSGLLHRRNV